jgi:heme-degrading monooxygenase HmoA
MDIPVVVALDPCGEPSRAHHVAVRSAMVARTWRGATARHDADAYLDYLDRTGVAECRATPGNCGVMVLRRPVGEETEFLFISYWDGEDSIRAFAGNDISRARFFAEDDRYLTQRDEVVRHYEVGSYELRAKN